MAVTRLEICHLRLHFIVMKVSLSCSRMKHTFFKLVPYTKICDKVYCHRLAISYIRTLLKLHARTMRDIGRFLTKVNDRRFPKILPKILPNIFYQQFLLQTADAEFLKLLLPGCHPQVASLRPLFFVIFYLDSVFS